MESTQEKHVRWLRSNRDSMFAELQKLCTIPSVSTEEGHVTDLAAAAGCTVELMKKWGASEAIQLHVPGASPYCLGTWKRGSVQFKMLVEGEEETGSPHLEMLWSAHGSLLDAGVLVVNDTDNLEIGKSSLTLSLRGLVTFRVQVSTASRPAHSGSYGGGMPDPTLALCIILSRLQSENGATPAIGGHLVVPELAQAFAKPQPPDPGALRREMALLDGVRLACPSERFYESAWGRHAVTILAISSGNIQSPANQIAASAEAVVSIRVAPGQSTDGVIRAVKEFLTANPPWGAHVSAELIEEPVEPWFTNPTDATFELARQAQLASFGVEPAFIGCGGSIGVVPTLAQKLAGLPAILLGIEDPDSRVHSIDESVHEEDWYKTTETLAGFLELLSNAAADKPATVLFYAHYDVQGFGNPDAWASHPTCATRRNGRIYARGAADDKAAIVAGACAATAWSRAAGNI